MLCELSKESHAEQLQSHREDVVDDGDGRLKRDRGSIKRPPLEMPAMHDFDVAKSHDFSGGLLFS